MLDVNRKYFIFQTKKKSETMGHVKSPKYWFMLKSEYNFRFGKIVLLPNNF